MTALRRPAAILTDIEGTTTPIAFVRDVLFPYARARLADFVALPPGQPDAAAALAEARRLAGEKPLVQALLDWMDRDDKITPLKTLQGLIWDQGYRDGALEGEIYPDVPPALRSWHAGGIKLYVYSSGSRAAQRLIFGHSTAGDLLPLFSGFFDTTIGPKRAAESYRAIAQAIGLPHADILFLSDIEAELDAAAQAGLAVLQLVRARDGTVASARHPAAATFGDIRIA